MAKLTQEFISEAFASEGYELLDLYENAHKLMRFVCPKGHHHQISWKSFNYGTRCRYCSKGKPVSHQELQQVFEDEGYTLLGQYNTVQEKLAYLCPNGHRNEMTLGNFRRNTGSTRCQTCSQAKRDDHRDAVHKAFESSGYIMLSEYENVLSSISCVCPEKHIYTTTWNNFRNGRRCPECSPRKAHSHSHVKKAFESEGYLLLDQYKNNKQPLRFICPNGHRHQIPFDGWQRGSRCGVCCGKYPTEQDKQVKKIKISVLKSINKEIKSLLHTKTISVSRFSEKIAIEIFDRLGDRPDGHHLDHIVPQSFFDFRIEDEIEACWKIENLRWLPAKENISRSNRLTKNEVLAFSDKQLDILAKASIKPKAISDIAKSIQAKKNMGRYTQLSLISPLLN